MVSIRDIDTLCRELKESVQYFCDKLKCERFECGEASGQVWAVFYTGVLEKHVSAKISEWREEHLKEWQPHSMSSLDLSSR
jgi:hypothetical protein